jgi:hypothetical protein
MSKYSYQMVSPIDRTTRWCTPASLYFAISMISLIIVAAQNLTGSNTVMRIGSVQTNVPNVLFIMVLKFLFIIFWTWVLNLICKDGYSTVSWIIVLVPLLMSVAIMIFAVS